MGLERFVDAQQQTESGFETALEELRTTGKRSHWIWYIFPQLDGLGSSSTAKHYALRDLAEADAFMNDPVLGNRLLQSAAVVSERLRAGTRLVDLMGSTIDAYKVVSSMTLFGALARRTVRSDGPVNLELLSRTAGEILTIAESQGFPACAVTRGRLAEDPSH